MKVLNGYLGYLPTLKNCPKAVATTKKGNVLFEEADLASIMLTALPLTWQNQYNLTHSMVPESPRALADLENIERVMLERYGEKQRSKDKAATARLKLDETNDFNLLSTITRPIKVTKLAHNDPEGLRDHEIDKIRENTGKITALVAVMTVSCKKIKVAQR